MASRNTWKEGREDLDRLLIAICQNLQIPQSLHDLVKERYHSVGAWIEKGSHPWLNRLDIYPQGSFRIATTVKPEGRNEFDLDIVCEFEQDRKQIEDPIALLDLVEHRLREHTVYKKMIVRKRRCVRMVYANEFHLDILPACLDSRSTPGCIVVPDRKLKDWKPSNPKGYAHWFFECCRVPEASVGHREVRADIEPFPAQENLVEKPTLKRVVQLFKRSRDVSFVRDPERAPISIVLTTLAGTHYRKEISESQAIESILEGIVNQIPVHEKKYGRLVVLNPSNADEDLSERWDDDPEAYSAFRSWIRLAHQKWKELLLEPGLAVVSSKLSTLLGTNPTKTAILALSDDIEIARREGNLGAGKGTGILTTAIDPNVSPIQRHTFHGHL